MHTLTIDTGTRGSGWAQWGPRGQLGGCGRGEPPYYWAGDGPGPHFDRVFVEVPRHYPHSKAKPRVDDLIALAIEAGRLKGRYEWGPCTVTLVTAPEWKGQAPKSVTENRARRELDPIELATVEAAILRDCGRNKSKATEVWDAIGIGLWAVGRGTR